MIQYERLLAAILEQTGGPELYSDHQDLVDLQKSVAELNQAIDHSLEAAERQVNLSKLVGHLVWENNENTVRIVHNS